MGMLGCSQGVDKIQSSLGMQMTMTTLDGRWQNFLDGWVSRKLFDHQNDSSSEKAQCGRFDCGQSN